MPIHGGLDHYDPAEDEHRYANGLTRAAGDIVMGRGMYDVMEYWDTLDLEDPATSDVERDFAEAWRETPNTSSPGTGRHCAPTLT